MKTSYLFLADGFEEIEALATVDILRRAGIEILTVSITADRNVKGAHGVTVVADSLFSEIDLSDAEWLIAPGGLPGSTNLHECEPLNDALKAHNSRGGKIAAICAAPAFVLAPIGILDGHDATGYPGTTTESEAIRWQESPAVTSGNIVTGNGPASALRFALAIIASTKGEEAANQVAAGMLLQ